MITKTYKVTCNNCSKEVSAPTKESLQSLMAHRNWVDTCLSNFHLCEECSKKIQFEEMIFIIDGKKVPMSQWMINNY